MGPKIHLEATFWRLGAEVWVETAHGLMMLPPDSPALAQIPQEALHVDPDLDKYVAELRAGAAGPRVPTTCDEATRTATIASIPVSYEGVRMVTSFWEGRPVHWHVRSETARALWKGKAVAEVRFEKGARAEAAMMLEIDGHLWAATSAMCMRADEAREHVAKLSKLKHALLRDGLPVDYVRGLLAAPLGTRHEPRHDEDAVWVGPARLQAVYFGVVAHRFPGCEWYATGPTSATTAVRDGERVALVMPAPLTSKGGAA